MTALLSTREALLAAIRDNPKEDQPRLEFADWLGEFGDDTDREHAELIRVQWELASTPQREPSEIEYADGRLAVVPVPVPRYGILKTRESELLRTLEPVLRRGRQCGRCLNGYTSISPYKSDVTAPKLPCAHCRGVGWLGSLAAGVGEDGGSFSWSVHVTRWRCGFPDEVSCTLKWFIENAAKLFAEWPITLVIITNRQEQSEQGIEVWTNPYCIEWGREQAKKLKGYKRVKEVGELAIEE